MTVAAEMRSFQPSITIVKERWLGWDGAFAVAFDAGAPRRVIVCICGHAEELHYRGGFSDSVGVTPEADVWMTRGG